jgi:glutamate racemase
VSSTSRPIGVFDSGVGGLTVLAQLCIEMPDEQFVYLGDTARLPYGTKSPDTVIRYAVQIAQALVACNVKAMVIACNTASAMALPAIRAHFPELPVMGVVEPGAQAAVNTSRNGRIGVIATEATVRGGAYQRAIVQRRPEAIVTAAACQLLVALAEEGWTDGPVARGAAARYLEPLFEPRALRELRPDTLVLGCTHFPMLRAVIADSAGPTVQIVDSAATTARAVRQQLHDCGQLRNAADGAGLRLRLLATDGAGRFAAIGSRFLGRSIAVSDVEIIDL